MMFLWLLLLAVAGTLAEVKNGYQGYKVYRLEPTTTKQMEFLRELRDLEDAQGLNDQVDFWTDPEDALIKAQIPVLVMISPEQQKEVLRMFNLEGISYTETIKDLAAAIQEESKEAPSNDRLAKNGEMSWTTYHRYETIEKFVKGLARDYPEIVQIETLGQSYEGRFLYLLKIGKPRADGKVKPAIWMDSQIHAREWIASATLTYMINKLVTEYSTNSTSKAMVDNVDWYVLPVINVDGFDYSHESANNRMYRGTRRVNAFSTQIGADPNRNYDHKWMLAGANQIAGGQIYAGAFPFSEIENWHLTEAALKIKDRLKAFLTIHSAAQMWLTPWGFDNSYPDDIEDLTALGRRATAALRSQYGTVYQVGSSTALLGAAAGATDDWAKAKAMVKYSYTVELRDRGQYGFILPAQFIIPSGRETFEAIVEVYKTIFSEFGPTLN